MCIRWCPSYCYDARNPPETRRYSQPQGRAGPTVDSVHKSARETRRVAAPGDPSASLHVAPCPWGLTMDEIKSSLPLSPGMGWWQVQTGGVISFWETCTCQVPPSPALSPAHLSLEGDSPCFQPGWAGPRDTSSHLFANTVFHEHPSNPSTGECQR